MSNKKEINYSDHMEMLYRVIGERVKTMRKKKGLKSYLEIDSEAINRSTYSSVEAGRRDVRISSIAGICDYYEIELSDFFKGISEDIILLMDFEKKSDKLKNNWMKDDK
jgi:transcriptional regulator with XRE-family HTH domain